MQFCCSCSSGLGVDSFCAASSGTCRFYFHYTADNLTEMQETLPTSANGHLSTTEGLGSFYVLCSSLDNLLCEMTVEIFFFLLLSGLASILTYGSF